MDAGLWHFAQLLCFEIQWLETIEWCRDVDEQKINGSGQRWRHFCLHVRSLDAESGMIWQTFRATRFLLWALATNALENWMLQCSRPFALSTSCTEQDKQADQVICGTTQLPQNRVAGYLSSQWLSFIPRTCAIARKAVVYFAGLTIFYTMRKITLFSATKHRSG